VRAVEQRLSFVQATEPRTLRASVKVEFTAPATTSYCWGYFPPETVVTIHLRRN
jgi:hypothetical protein